jgi:ribosomal protein S21
MAINTEITSNNNESSANTIRRFSRRVKSSGVINKAKSLRYRNRKTSKTLQKKQALRLLKKRKEREKKIKMGKLKDTRKKHNPIILDDNS